MGNLQFLDIGAKLRLWGSGSRGQSYRQSSLLITAHGVPRLFNRQFVVPKGTTILFYGPEGTALLDPGFRAVAAKRAVAYSVSGPETTCSDYSLSKFQGYRGTFAGALFGKIAKPFVSANGETYQEINDYLAFQAANGGSINVDVMTIRADPGKISITLSDALTTLRLNGYAYRRILCSFCRGVMGGYAPPAKKITDISRPVRTSPPRSQPVAVPPISDPAPSEQPLIDVEPIVPELSV